MASAEKVWVLRRSDLFAGQWPQGFMPLAAAESEALLGKISELGFLADRAQAEAEPAWKQPIPYCLVRQGSEWLCVQRRKQGTEGRLHNLYSVGLGGHIGPEDQPLESPDLCGQALMRELAEELVLPDFAPANLQFRGILNDDSNAVGQVHLGLVYELSLNPAQAKIVKIREISKLLGGFRTLVELRKLWQDPGALETWSRKVLEALVFPKAVSGDRYQESTQIER